jgi:hypothetical protein
MNQLTQPAFTGFFRATEDASPCSIAAALQLQLVQPCEDSDYLHIRKRGKLPVSAAIAMGLIDEEAAAAIATHPNVLRGSRGYITLPEVSPAPRGPLGDLEGTPVGAVVIALQKFMSTRGDDDAATFGRALAAALKA